MREARSFSAWWETLCEMGRQMRFECIELWRHGNGAPENACTWNSPHGEFATGKTAQFNLPIHKEEGDKYEVRARIWVNGCLELGGRQAMLLARLMDEFPPPAQKAETETHASEPRFHADSCITGAKESPQDHSKQAGAGIPQVHLHPA